MSLFGSNRKNGKKRYRDFVESTPNNKIENPFDDVVSGIILGSVEFVAWVKKAFLTQESDSKEIPQLKRLKPRPTPDDIIEAVCKEFDCKCETIIQKGKKRIFNGMWQFISVGK